MIELRRVPCVEVDDLAGFYVLDALAPDETAGVSAHLASCPELHEAIIELAPLGPALATTVEPQPGPAWLRDRVLAAVASTPQIPDLPLPARWAGEAVTPPAPQSGVRAPVAPADVTVPGPLARPESRPAPDARHGVFDRLRQGGWGWAGLAAGAIAIVLIGVGLAGTLQRGADQAERLALLRAAVAATADPTSNVASLAGSDSAASATGFAVFPPDQPGYIVISGLPNVPEGSAYQAWYLADGVPTSAGLLTVSDDGLGTLTEMDPVPGTSIIALTVEARPGVEAPTVTPIVVGELPTATA